MIALLSSCRKQDRSAATIQFFFALLIQSCIYLELTERFKNGGHNAAIVLMLCIQSVPIGVCREKEAEL